MIVIHCTLFICIFSVKIAPGALVCDECELVGDITIGTFIKGNNPSVLQRVSRMKNSGRHEAHN